MEFYLAKTLNDTSFETALDKVTSALKDQGFGVITEIDVKDTLKKKIDVDFRKYKILGACNPALAHQALESNDKIGIMLPCNVVVQETPEGKIEVSTVNPMEAMKPVATPELEKFAGDVTQHLQSVLDVL
ncbi:DUF302 domain-containing protein [Prolixibacter denitrificans]|uniref:Uncharacterized protein (DUF302 family) n=1 Tax=Prolixibacter denitrificans TaxID=1541063 RepID=A0A2P8CKY7_9BACT|nr:DUF302 domain-containing protein [Prolixibacter denitrificans]PSK85627.1 uncharacterized protein (DUF302 family) [Prolixibacter denitrificans]GET20247.1 hypothetical protein JCM18694_04930 [Prolixibacter denitrificans]